METFLSILAQIGIIALIVFIVVVIIVVLLVFVDFSYKISGDFNIKGDNKQYKASAVIHSFLYMIYAAVTYDATGALLYQVRVFGIPVIDSRRPKKEKKKKKPKAAIADNSGMPAAEVHKSDEALKGNDTKNAPANNAKAAKNEQRESERSGFLEKVKKFFSAIKKFFVFITDEKNKAAFKLIKVQIFKLLGKIKPKKISGDLTFGADSPDVTGKILGVSYIAMGIFGTGINLNPDFDNKCLIGSVSIKGGFKVITFIVMAIKLLSNKTIRGYISTVSKLANKAGE